MYRILAINPGSTSTKIAAYGDKAELFYENILHASQELMSYKSIYGQLEYRTELILDKLHGKGFEPADFDAFVGRGGIIHPVPSGAYRVDDTLITRLRNPLTEHASNLGGLIADKLAEGNSAIKMIYDPVTVDEMCDEARVLGLPEKERPSLGHALNMRAVAQAVSQKLGGHYRDFNFVVAHMGGGITMSAHHKGVMEDVISDDEGTFSPERTGNIPTRWLIEFIFEKGLNAVEANRMLRGNKAGFNAYFGTSDIRKIEAMASEGDFKADLLLRSLVYNIAKDIGGLSATLGGDVDRIILTGGLAYSKRLVGEIIEKVGFIAPVEVIAGEIEMRALANGALLVLEGREQLKVYTDRPRKRLFEEYA
ncbi:MAG: butyrate kinase [Clostridiaceae bacterium]|nr:butyrate kinase [Clostridiaceae bacterium]